MYVWNKICFWKDAGILNMYCDQVHLAPANQIEHFTEHHPTLPNPRMLDCFTTLICLIIYGFLLDGDTGAEKKNLYEAP